MIGAISLLLLCHYLADFCLTTPAMIRAKSDGKSYGPLLLHAGIHAALISVLLAICHASWQWILYGVSLEFLSHFLIDTGKGRLMAKFPKLADMHNKPYWMLFGLDQLLHLLILVAIFFVPLVV